MAQVKGSNAVRVEGLNRCLRILSKFPKETQADLRTEAQSIATRIMVPEWQKAAMQAGPWGPKLADSIRAKRDRVPAVSMGYARKVYSGGASTIMTRYPAHEGGQAGRDGGRFVSDQRPDVFRETGWIFSAKSYKAPAMRSWNAVLTRVVNEYGRQLTYGG